MLLNLSINTIQCIKIDLIGKALIIFCSLYSYLRVAR